MEKQLRDREEETRIAAGYKAEFLANMSHEIRTPMNVICGMAELLENCDLSPLENEYVGMIKSSSNNLLGIVNDILDTGIYLIFYLEILTFEVNHLNLICHIPRV